MVGGRPYAAVVASMSLKGSFVVDIELVEMTAAGTTPAEVSAAGTMGAEVSAG